MSGQKKGGQDGRAAGGGGYSKRGKPRPGTGGFRRDKLEGKGPTPPASMRPGHPAQRAAAKAAKGAGRGRPGPGRGERGGERGNERGGDSRGRPDFGYENPAGRGSRPAARGSGEGPE